MTAILMMTTTMLASGDNDASKSDMTKPYPHLSQALGGGDDCFDPTDPSFRRSMHSLLRELNDLLSTEYRLDVSVYLII